MGLTQPVYLFVDSGAWGKYPLLNQVDMPSHFSKFISLKNSSPSLQHNCIVLVGYRSLIILAAVTAGSNSW